MLYSWEYVSISNCTSVLSDLWNPAYAPEEHCALGIVLLVNGMNRMMTQLSVVHCRILVSS